MAKSERSRADSEEIDAVCDHFEQELIAGRSPNLKNVLEAATDCDRTVLFQELLPIEIEWLHRVGLPCEATDYLGRFPDMHSAIKECFAKAWTAALPYVPTLVGPTKHEDAGRSLKPKTPDRFQAGDQFGRYEIVSPIASGGMGAVYRARDPELGREVALKIIRSAEFAFEEQIARFQREAQAAAKFDHPNIVPVYEVGQSEGVHFFSMALIEGPSLGERVAKEPMASRDAARLMMHVSRAVQHAHEHDIVHRDLKPQNILLDADETPRIADFGLARDLRNFEWNYLWAQAHSELLTLRGTQSDVSCFDISPDGTRVAAVGGSTADLKVWDFATNEEFLSVVVGSQSRMSRSAQKEIESRRRASAGKSSCGMPTPAMKCWCWRATLPKSAASRLIMTARDWLPVEARWNQRAS